MSLYLGIDTSNYTTSAAIFDSVSGEMINRKKLLPVEDNSIGLMQSKALFCHVRQLPEVVGAAFSALNERLCGADISLKAVCVSDKPRNVEGSYMPVFLAGVATAESVAASHNIPCYHSAHQPGHVLAALYSADRLDLIDQPFLAFHVSGGTTECLLVTPNDEHIINRELVAHSLDLKAGQAIDRIGVMLGLHFPAGAELDKLAQKGSITKKPKPTLKDCDCCLSGLQNICEKMMRESECPENIARFAIEYVYETVAQMSERVYDKYRKQYGELPFVYAGGVMSNSIISERLSKRGGIFAKPEYSSDNAAGMAMAAYLFDKKATKGE